MSSLQLYLQSNHQGPLCLRNWHLDQKACSFKGAHQSVSHSFWTTCLRGRVGPCAINVGCTAALSCRVRRPRQFNPAVPLPAAARMQLGNTCKREFSTADQMSGMKVFRSSFVVEGRRGLKLAFQFPEMSSKQSEHVVALPCWLGSKCLEVALPAMRREMPPADASTSPCNGSPPRPASCSYFNILQPDLRICA